MAENPSKRDNRLVMALLLFAIAILSGAVQFVIVMHYIDAAVTGNWANFSELYSVEAPASGPVAFCFDYCAPEMPFAAGWVGIVSFVLGLASVANAWMRPKLGA